MRSKVRPRNTPAPGTPAGSGRPPRAQQGPPPRRTGLVWLGIIAFVLGATAALAVDRISPSVNLGSRPVPSGSAIASPLANASPAASASEFPSAEPSVPPSLGPSPSPSQAAPIIAAELPTKVGKTTLQVQSITGTASLGTAPSIRAMTAAITNLGKKPEDLEIAEALDPTGASALSILGFRLPGVDPAKLEPLILTDWLSASSPGVTTSTITMSGQSLTRISYGSEGASDYILVHGDGIFIIETANQTEAASVVSLMTSGTAAPGASPGTSPAGSPGASPAATPSPAGSAAAPAPSPSAT
jgi:hypothetical protein